MTARSIFGLQKNRAGVSKGCLDFLSAKIQLDNGLFNLVSFSAMKNSQFSGWNIKVQIHNT